MNFLIIMKQKTIFLSDVLLPLSTIGLSETQGGPRDRTNEIIPRVLTDASAVIDIP